MSKLRKKILKRLAQADPTTISGTPSGINVSSLFPSIITAWSTDNLESIQDIVDTLNQAIFILSAGQLDFNKLRVQQFNVDTSKYPDRILKNTVKFTIVVYNNMLTNNGAAFSKELTAEERKIIIGKIKGSLQADEMPDGGISQELVNKIGGNLKTKISSSLDMIK